jgi:hypothetical protein
MTRDRVVVDRRTNFSEHGQLYVAHSRVNTLADLSIVIPPDLEDFTIRPPVDLEVVDILETRNSSGGSAIPSRLPEDHLDAGLCSLDSSEESPSDELSCSDDYVGGPYDELDSVPTFDDRSETAVRSRQNISLSTKPVSADRILTEPIDWNNWHQKRSARSNEVEGCRASPDSAKIISDRKYSLR